MPEELITPTQIPVQSPPTGQPGPSEPPAAAPAKGQSSPAKGKKPAAPPPGKGQPAAPAEPFYWTLGPDGRRHEFADRKELDEHFKKALNFQSDYSKKTEEAARYAERLRSREQELENQAKSLKELRERYNSFEKASKSHPDAFKSFADRIMGPPSGDETFSSLKSLLDERLSPLEKKLEDIFSERDFNREQDTVFTKLAEEFPDLDRAGVEDFMGTLVNDPLAMTRAMVHALQYRKTLQEGSPEQQQRVAEAAAAAKRNGRMLPGGSPPAGERSFNTLEEAKQAALADARSQGEI